MRAFPFRSCAHSKLRVRTWRTMPSCSPSACKARHPASLDFWASTPTRCAAASSACYRQSCRTHGNAGNRPTWPRSSVPCKNHRSTKSGCCPSRNSIRPNSAWISSWRSTISSHPRDSRHGAKAKPSTSTNSCAPRVANRALQCWASRTCRMPSACFSSPPCSRKSSPGCADNPGPRRFVRCSTSTKFSATCRPSRIRLRSLPFFFSSSRRARSASACSSPRKIPPTSTTRRCRIAARGSSDACKRTATNNASSKDSKAPARDAAPDVRNSKDCSTPSANAFFSSTAFTCLHP